MKHVALAGLLAAALVSSVLPVSAQESSNPAAGTVLGSVTLTRKVLADGQPLAPGTYQVRLSADQPTPVVGQSPDGARYVEFVRAGKVAGREVATVISNTDLNTIGKIGTPPSNGSKFEMLKGADYFRVWINRGTTNYLIHLPRAV